VVILLKSIHLIGETEVGLVTKNISLKSLADGNSIAFLGEAGYQADLLLPRLRFKLWPIYTVEKKPWVQVPAGQIGVVIAQIGKPLPPGAKSARYCHRLGCTYSIHPVLTDADFTTEVDLSGTWTAVTKVPEQRKAYTFSVAEHGDTSIYEATWRGKEFLLEVGKIGDSRYLQFKRADSPPEAPPLLTSLPVYGFAKFKIEGDTLTAYRFNDNAVVRLFKEKKIPFIEHGPSAMVRFYVLTQDTTALQTMLKENEERLFEEFAIFERTKVGQHGKDSGEAGAGTKALDGKKGSTPTPQ